MPYALLVDPEEMGDGPLTRIVRRHGFELDAVASIGDARAAFARQIPDAAFLSVDLPDGSGVRFFEEFHQRETIPTIFLDHRPCAHTAVRAFRSGAFDYLIKPFDEAHVAVVLASLLRSRPAAGDRRELDRLGDLIGASLPMQCLFDLIERVAPTDATVLAVGESGTGKDVVARTIHRLSPRHAAPFLAVNCGALSPQLIESELFGHERGSFTGAERTHKGVFERAAGGTLFLDEIAEMPLEFQARLLRVLENRRILRVGAEREIAIDVRIVAATNRDLGTAVGEGRIREDLLYRLSVFPLVVPALRERDGDVELLARHFLEHLNRVNKTEKQFATRALMRLREHMWAGNVRELWNVVQRAYILADGHLDPMRLETTTADAETSAGAEAVALGDDVFAVRVGSRVDDVERRLVLASLEHFHGNKSRTAKALGISLKTLYNKLNRYRAGIGAAVEL